MTKYLTSSGYNLLKAEIKKLSAKLIIILDRIIVARALGDYSENSELQTAKSDKLLIDSRLGFLNNILNNSEIITKDKIDDDSIIVFGSLVTIIKGIYNNLDDINYNSLDIRTYRIVGDYEADPLNNLISYNTPIVKAMLLKHVKDNFTINNIIFTIIKITWP